MLKMIGLLAGFIFIASYMVSFVTDDPHWVQRGGALLAALAALSAVFEASTENSIRLAEHSKPGRISALGHDPDVAVSLLNRIREARFRKMANHLSHEKVKTVFWISSMAVVGEILHGFGDLLFEITAGSVRHLLG